MTISKTAKIAISLPEDLLADIERERKTSGESRSEYFRRAVETLLGMQERSEVGEKYLQAYRKHPEGAGEVEAARRAARNVLSQEPWE